MVLADWGIFGILLAVYTGVTAWLFYHQAFGSEQSFHSDLRVYILVMQGLYHECVYPYPLFFKLGAFFHLFMGPETAMVTALVILNSGAVAVMKYYLQKNLIGREGALPCGKEGGFLPGGEGGLRALITFLTFALFFVSMLFPVTGIQLPGIAHRYKGVFTPNPYHNATYMAARPFAIAAFFQFGELLGEYEKGFSWKKGLLFGLSLLLATLAKPSFTIVLVGAAGLIMLWRLFRSRFANFRPTLYLGLMFIPTFADLLYQFFGVFGPDESGESGMGFGFLKVWSLHCGNIPLALLLALAFPLTVFVFHHRQIRRDTVYRFSLQILLMGTAMAMLLYEKGERMQDFNFSWGYMHGLFFAFTGAVIVLVKSTVRREKPLPLLAGEWLVLPWHLGCGLLYFKNSLAGFLYY